MSGRVRSCVGLAMLGAIWGLPVALVPGQTPDSRLRRVFADWEKRQEGIRSIRYRILGKVITPRGMLTGEPDLPAGIKGEFPARDLVTDRKVMLLIDFKSNRYRVESFGQEFSVSNAQFIPRVTTTVFDGKALKIALPREANTNDVHMPDPLDADVSIVTGNLDALPVEANYHPVFFGHGIVPTVHNPLKQDQFKIQVDTEIWSVRGQGIHAGRPCLVLRTQPIQHMNAIFDEVWVDVERDSAVLRYVNYTDANPWFDYDVEYQRTPQGWLPKSWTWIHRWQGKTRRIERMQVHELTVAPAFTDQDFDVEIKPGMIISQSAYTGNAREDANPQAYRKYRVAENGGWNEIINGVEQKRPWSVLVWVGFGLLVAGGLSLWLFRLCRYQRTRRSN